jgi:hypothetical protein
VRFSPTNSTEPWCRLFQSRDDVQQRGFAAAGWPDNTEEFTVPHFEIDPAERSELPLPGRELCG